MTETTIDIARGDKATTPYTAEQAEAIFVGACRTLATELLRVIAEAGDPYKAAIAIFDASDSFATFRESKGHYPSSTEIRRALDLEAALVDNRPWTADYKANDRQADTDLAMKKIRKGALREAASVFGDQLTQMHAAESLIRDGITDLQSIKNRQYQDD